MWYIRQGKGFSQIYLDGKYVCDVPNKQGVEMFDLIEKGLKYNELFPDGTSAGTAVCGDVTKDTPAVQG
jgi:hypothetical protein